MAQLYRKALLDRLSSPEQLDKMIVITSPSFWIAALGAVLIVAVALVWSIFGRLPVKVESSGIYMNSQGLDLVYSDISGKVNGVKVSPGDPVEAGQLLFTIDDEDIRQEIVSLQTRIADVQAVTLESTDDRITMDNKDLLSIKAQMESVNLQLEQNQMTLSARREEYNQIKSKVDRLHDELMEMRGDYYGTLGRAPKSDKQLDYEDAQSQYNRESSAYESAAGQYSQAVGSYQSLMSETLGYAIGQYQALLDSLSNSADGSDGTTDSDPSGGSTIGSSELDREIVQSYLNALKDLSTSQSPDQFPDDAVVALDYLNPSFMAQLKEGWSQVSSARSAAERAEDDLDDAYDDMQDARDDYYAYTDRQNALAAKKEKLSVQYGDLYNEYSAQYSLMVNLEQTVHSLETQVVADSMAMQMQKNSYINQFVTLKASIVDSLEKELDKYQRSQEKAKIIVAQDGIVSDVLVSEGSVITQGSELAQIRPHNSEELIICYIPVANGKKVSEGMKVMVYPSTVNRQEYGHMEATVVSVDNYVTSANSMKNFLGDDSLVNAFSQSGPVIAVTCRLREDPTTASGYYWSSNKGAQQVIPEGTLISADIVTEYKTPISMVIPLLKEKLSVKVDESAEGRGGAA